MSFNLKNVFLSRNLSFVEVKKSFVEETRSLSKFFGVLSKLSLSSSHQVFLKWRSLSLKKKEVFHLCFWSHLQVSLSSSHQVFLNWNCSLSLKRKPKSFWVITSLQSKSFITPSLSFRRKSSKSFKESFVEETKSFCLMIYELAIILKRYVAIPIDSTKQVFLWRRSLSPIFFFWKKKSKSFVTINVFLIKEIPVFHNPGIIICYGKEKKQTKQQPRNELHERKKAKPQQNWTSKLCETGTVKSRLENKKQKVFEFSIESQMPKQNGKKI